MVRAEGGPGPLDAALHSAIRSESSVDVPTPALVVPGLVFHGPGDTPSDVGHGRERAPGLNDAPRKSRRAFWATKQVEISWRPLRPRRTILSRSPFRPPVTGVPNTPEASGAPERRRPIPWRSPLPFPEVTMASTPPRGGAARVASGEDPEQLVVSTLWRVAPIIRGEVGSGSAGFPGRTRRPAHSFPGSSPGKMGEPAPHAAGDGSRSGAPGQGCDTGAARQPWPPGGRPSEGGGGRAMDVSQEAGLPRARRSEASSQSGSSLQPFAVRAWAPRRAVASFAEESPGVHRGE